MKIKYYLMGAALVAMSAGFTSCSDDDDAPVSPAELTVPKDIQRIKIGVATRLPLTSVVLDGAGEYNAFSLNPEVADITADEAGNRYVEGFKNGKTQIVLSDATGTYKTIDVSVYTTDNMTLTHTQLKFVTPLGNAASNNEVSVAEGNGEYTIESDNPKVAPAIDPETGAISLRATSGKDPYVATVTVHDCTGLQASFTVNVEATFDGFVQADIDEILAKTETDLYGKCKDPSDGTTPYYFPYRDWGYGEYTFTESNGIKSLGWWMEQWGYDYGGLRVEYPATAAIGQDVEGKLYYQYSSSSWYDLYTYTGTARVLEDSAERVVVIWWNVDLDNELINRAWFVYYK